MFGFYNIIGQEPQYLETVSFLPYRRERIELQTTIFRQQLQKLFQKLHASNAEIVAALRIISLRFERGFVQLALL